MALPSGVLVRGRALRRPLPDAATRADHALHLLSRRPAESDRGPHPATDVVWVRWPDFWLPSDRPGFAALLRVAHRRARGERVEIVCGGGVGRTGTALACLAVLDGVPADQAVAYVRDAYAPRAVETPWQRRFARRFDPVRG